jgi:hypothetical protein
MIPNRTSPAEAWRYSAELILIGAAKTYDWVWEAAAPPFYVGPQDLLPEEEAFVATWPEDLRDDLRFSLSCGLLEIDEAGELRVPAWLEETASPPAGA